MVIPTNVEIGMTYVGSLRIVPEIFHLLYITETERYNTFKEK